MKNEYKTTYDHINLWLRKNHVYIDITLENDKIKFYVKYNRARFTVLSNEYIDGYTEVFMRCLNNKRYRKRNNNYANTAKNIIERICGRLNITESKKIAIIGAIIIDEISMLKYKNNKKLKK